MSNEGKSQWVILGNDVLSDDRLTINRNRCMNERHEVFPYSYVSFKNGVMIIPVLDDGRLVLIDQYRHAVRCRLTEFAAGAVEEGESPEEAAARELKEETGYTAGRLRLLCGFHSLPGICNEYLPVYVAEELTAGEADRESSEDIRVTVMSTDEVRRAIEAGELTSMPTVAAFYRYIFERR